MSYEIDASRDLEAEMWANKVKAKEIRVAGQNILKDFEVAKRKWSKARFPTKEKLETIEEDCDGAQDRTASFAKYPTEMLGRVRL